MKKVLQKTQNNWLLYLSLICVLLCGVLAFTIIKGDGNFKSSRDAMDEGGSLSLFVIGSLLIAPVLEELSFRSFFANKKWFLIIGCVMLPGCMYLMANNYFGWISLVLIYSLLYWNYKIPSKWAGILLILVNSFLFSFIHYRFNDFLSIATYGGVLWRFAFGLTAVWVTQNFGLAKSMLFHVFNNSIAVLMFVLVVQFPDTTKHTYEDKNVRITWNRVPRFNNSKAGLRMFYSGNVPDKVIGTNCSPTELYFEEISKDSIVVSSEHFMKYNFNIKAKDKSLDLLENPKIIKDFLIKNKLITLMKRG